MFHALFLSVLHMSMTASLVILLVVLVRLFLKKAPKIFSYALWAVVLFRLVCPFSFESAVGLFPINKTPIAQDIVSSAEPQINTGYSIIDNVANSIISAPNIGNSTTPLQMWAFIGSVIWVIGILAMLIYSMIQFARLKRKLIGSTLLRDHIYLADHISSPFVMGFIKPTIYLPSSMDVTEQKFIIAHETHHIKRFDYIARILGFIALAIHWFNPLAWLAFALSGKDMEMSCDEAVIKRTATDIRAEYSQSLLRFATGRKRITAAPLAFGEGDTKDRVKNVMKYKKPMMGIVITLIVLVAGLLVVLGTNAQGTASGPKNLNTSGSQGIQAYKRVELYVWKNEIDETCFTLLSDTNRNKTEEEIYDKSIATTDIRKIAHALLEFDDGLHLFITQMNETDFTKEEMAAYEQEIIENIGGSMKNYMISIGSL